MSSIRSNLVIDFTQGDCFNQNEFKQKMVAEGERFGYVKSSDEAILSAALRDIDDNSRIYIVSHGLPNQTLLDDTHYQKLADILAKNLPDKNIRTPNSKLKISLISCFAGRGENGGWRALQAYFIDISGNTIKFILRLKPEMT